MSIIELREKQLKELYKTVDSVELKTIQLNHFCMVVDDLKNAAKEIIDLVPGVEAVALAKNEQEITKLSQKAIREAKMTLWIFKEAIEDLKGEEL